MAGIRIGGVAIIEAISPPFSDFEGSSGDGDVNVYRHHRSDAAGDATLYSDYADGGTTIEGIHDPVLSPDESKIAFIGVPAATNLGALYVVDNVPGSTPVQLEDDASSWINHPMWSPDSSTIIFTRGNAAGNIYGGKIETIPAAGGSPTVLYTPAANYRAFRPAYNFDGTRIAFMLTDLVSTDDGLWVMDDDGANATEVDAITEYRLDGPQLSWANSLDALVYEDGAASATVYKINGDGTGKTALVSAGGFRVGKFAWFPDDSFAICAWNSGSIWEFLKLELDGSGDTQLNASHGAANQAWMKQPIIYRNRIWFIEVASGASGGMISSMALDGTDYVEELNVNDATLLDWFSGGTGFYYQ